MLLFRLQNAILPSRCLSIQPATASLDVKVMGHPIPCKTPCKARQARTEVFFQPPGSGVMIDKAIRLPYSPATNITLKAFHPIIAYLVTQANACRTSELYYMLSATYHVISGRWKRIKDQSWSQPCRPMLIYLHTTQRS
jgi:hypothetical protein